MKQRPLIMTLVSILAGACSKSENAETKRTPTASEPAPAAPIAKPAASPDRVVAKAPSAPPKALGLGKDLDPILQARCDESTIVMEKETLDEATAKLVGMPAGDVGHFRCAFKQGVGSAKWDMSLADDAAGGIYAVSIFGDAFKGGEPGKPAVGVVFVDENGQRIKYAANHFARLGAEFVKPLVSADGKAKLDQLVKAYAQVAPVAGTRWTVDDAVINLMHVMAGDEKGKWVMSVTAAQPQ